MVSCISPRHPSPSFLSWPETKLRPWCAKLAGYKHQTQKPYEPGSFNPSLKNWRSSISCFGVLGGEMEYQREWPSNVGKWGFAGPNFGILTHPPGTDWKPDTKQGLALQIHLKKIKANYSKGPLLNFTWRCPLQMGSWEVVVCTLLPYTPVNGTALALEGSREAADERALAFQQGQRLPYQPLGSRSSRSSFVFRAFGALGQVVLGIRMVWWYW